MPFDGQGNFIRNYNWVADRDANITIKADRHDADHDDFAEGLSNCVTRDGQSKLEADLNLGSHKLINCGAGLKETDVPQIKQVQGGLTYGEDTSLESGKIQIRLSPPLTQYTAGQGFAFKLKTDKTAPVTFKCDALDVCDVLVQGEEPVKGTLKAGVIYEGRYDYDAANERRILHITSASGGGKGVPVGVVFAYVFKDTPAGAWRLDGGTIPKVNRNHRDFYQKVLDYGVTCTVPEYEQELKDYFGNCGKFATSIDADGDITLRLPCVTDHVKGVTSVADIAQCVNDQLLQHRHVSVAKDSPYPYGATSKSYSGGGGGIFGGGYDENTKTGQAEALVKEATLRAGDKTEVRSVQYPYFIQVVTAATQDSLVDYAEVMDLLKNQNQAAIETLEKTGGSLPLKAGKIYAVKLESETTFVLPEITDKTLFAQILVQAEVAGDFAVHWGTNCFFSDEPSVSAGRYNVMFEYDPAAGAWVCGVLEKRTVG